MESTGIYWKSVFSHLEAAGIAALVVNALHVKNVPGRKTDVSDSEWLAQLARFGLLRGSFIPPKDLRELRLISRCSGKLAQRRQPPPPERTTARGIRRPVNPQRTKPDLGPIISPQAGPQALRSQHEATSPPPRQRSGPVSRAPPRLCFHGV